jgi:predicted dehydrogenase
MQTLKTLSIAIIGCGVVAREHLLAIQKCKNTTLVAVCDTNEDLAKRTAKKFNVKYYTNFDEIIHNEEVKLVDICTPPKTHYSLAINAMETGHHVLVEKPMALGLIEAQKMTECAQKNHVKLCVVHNELFLPVILKTRTIVNRGDIGELVGISSTNSLPHEHPKVINTVSWSHELPGGIFGEMLPHPLYLVVGFLGKLEPVVVYSKKISLNTWSVADELRIVLENERAIATIIESVNWARDVMAFDLFGTKASLHVDVWGETINEYGVAPRGRISRAQENFLHTFQRIGGTGKTILSHVTGSYQTGHYTLIKRYCQSILNNSKPPVSPEEALEVVRLYEEITSRIGKN